MSSSPGRPREASALAHSNIALAKYWGKRDVANNLPAVGSVSITLAALTTRTQVRFDESLSADRLTLNGKSTEDGELVRVTRFLDRIRSLAGIRAFADIRTENDFPTAAGLASSASGFAALAVAASGAAGLDLSPTDLSALARYGSVSAARSVFGGFVELNAHEAIEPFARPLLAAQAWPLEVLVAVTSTARKPRSSSEAMAQSAATSPYYDGWLNSSHDDFVGMKQAIVTHDFTRLAELAEHSCLKLHALILSTRPPTLYWNPTTITLIEVVQDLRRKGVPVFFTIDAGPQVKAVFLPGHADEVREAIAAVAGVERIIHSQLGEGAHRIEDDK